MPATTPPSTATTGSAIRAPRVGLFGLLGSGNIGNDVSMEAVLTYLRERHPHAVVDAMCAGPERLRDRYDVDATPMTWHHDREQEASGVTAVALKALGKVVDTYRTAAWVRRHDAVVVPGMGVLEASLPLRPWETPYALFVLCLSGRIFGTKVALVSVGANVIKRRATRWLLDQAARLAFYRSYRDEGSKAAMEDRGLDTTNDPVFPDLAFGIPDPPHEPGDRRIVGVGLMAYYGTNDDRRQEDRRIHSTYMDKMQRFIEWLLREGYTVRVLIGDACDEPAVDDIIAAVRSSSPGVGPDEITAHPVTSYSELTEAMSPAGTIVATRYHNVQCALRLAKPTISLGYGQKNVELMDAVGLGDFCQHAASFDVDQLIDQFRSIGRAAERARPAMIERNQQNYKLLNAQFETLSVLLSLTRDGLYV